MYITLIHYPGHDHCHPFNTNHTSQSRPVRLSGIAFWLYYTWYRMVRFLLDLLS